MKTELDKMKEIINVYFEADDLTDGDFDNILNDIRSSRIFPSTPDDVSLAAQKIKERREALKLSQSDIGGVLGLT
ncbi:MAG: hypothetical protein ACRDBG_06130, partial [Waterburya sp.]